MFQPNKTQMEAESDSDWDSLPGDVPEPSTSPEVTPRHQPTPPTGSTKSQLNHKRPQVKQQTALPTLEKTSTASSPSNRPRPKQETSLSQTPNQVYGKGAVTNFVDRSGGINTTIFSDHGLENRKNKELVSPDVKENKGQQSSQRSGESGIDTDLNEVDYHQRNPPFTDFQAALPQQDSTRLNMQTDKPHNGKVKTAYMTSKGIRGENHSWDSDSDAEPISHSRQHLTPRENNSKKTKRHQEQNSLAKDTISVDSFQPDKVDLKTIVVPQDTENKVTGFSYHFDHGHNLQLNVKPEWKEPYMKKLADRSEKRLHYFWQEVFNTLRFISDFFLIFVLELLRFILRDVAVRLLGGIITVTGDHFLKPFFTALFNGIIQPSFIFTRNVLAGAKNLLQPLMDISGSFVAQGSSLLRALRLFEITWKPVYERGQKHDIHVL